MARQEAARYTVNEAIELLAEIADLAVEIEEDTHLSHKERVLAGKRLLAEKVDWINDPDVGSTVEKIRGAFDAVYQYVAKRYQDESKYTPDHETIEGIKKIMVLVGEAASKLDKYTDLFAQLKPYSATMLPEYKKIREFYRKKIDQRIDEHVLSRWIEGISRSPWVAKEPRGDLREAQHVYVDLDTVVKDTEYELLLMRKEDGSRFYNPRLLRNLKLVCDFGSSIGDAEDGSLYYELQSWQDKMYHAVAGNILSVVRMQTEMFFQEAYKYRNRELCGVLSKALMALMLASNPRHRSDQLPSKTCTEYFYDFQAFLRHALHTREYQKMLVYPPGRKNRIGKVLLEVVQALSCSLYVSLVGMQVVLFPLEETIGKGRGKYSDDGEVKHVYQKVKRDYRVLQRALRRHANAPLIELIGWIEEGGAVDFDPLVQNNIPNHWFELKVGKKRIGCKRVPGPTYQRIINKATVADEFKAFLYSCLGAGKKHLQINLQDRTSWREYARAKEVEHLDQTQMFGEALTVVTMAIDTDFYHQRADYRDLDSASGFVKQFKEHLHSDFSGFYFPDKGKKKLLAFCDKVVCKVHELFFGGRKTLKLEERQAFISLVYLFVQAKCLDMYSPDTYALSCKDGIDVGSSQTALHFAVWSLLGTKRMSEADEEYLNLILHGPALLIRERPMLLETMNRFLEALGTVETVREAMGAAQFVKEVKKEFGPLFERSVLDAKIRCPSTYYHD